ncbi:MAG: 5'/3'-nucleotidase SurE [Clostridia bacterium]
MKILISNDDGIGASGLKTIANSLKRAGHDIIVVAPSGNRSGFSHSLTIRKPMRFVRDIDGFDDGISVYSLDGTPADCVKFGCYIFHDENIELVVSGINDGPNMGVDTMYSGTVGAGMEGLNQGKKAIAISVAEHSDTQFFETSARVVVENLERLAEIDDKVLFNINCPNTPYEDIKGVLFTKIGELNFENVYQLTNDDGEFYSLDGQPRVKQSQDIETDVGAIANGYVSITPIMQDRTNHEILGRLK